MDEERYAIYLGHSSLFRRLRGSQVAAQAKHRALEHQFIVYRGFTYEFGGSYGVQMLDNNDPNYKYKNLKMEKFDYVGISLCSLRQVAVFLNQWKNTYSYKLLSCNCQNFACRLKAYLIKSPCHNRPNATKQELLDYINNNGLQLCQGWLLQLATRNCLHTKWSANLIVSYNILKVLVRGHA